MIATTNDEADTKAGRQNHFSRHTILLDRAKRRPQRFAVLRPEIISSVTELPDSVARATKNSLWISYDKGLTDALLRQVAWPTARLGSALLLHPLNIEQLPPLETCFQRVVFSAKGGFLPAGELAEALAAAHASDLILGGSVDFRTRTLSLWRGHLERLTIPFSAFEESGDGMEPDFESFSVTDCGQSIRLGQYEAASDALLYEFDPEYRRRVTENRRQAERSFGASLRRLRKQRGLRREDFAPLAAKTIARIEQGQVQRIHPRTLNVIARRLSVSADEIETY